MIKAFLKVTTSMLLAFAVLTVFANEEKKDETPPAKKDNVPPKIEKPVKVERNPFESQLKKIARLREKMLNANQNKREEIQKELKKEEEKLKEDIKKQTDKIDKDIERIDKKIDTANEKAKEALEKEIEAKRERKDQIIKWSKEDVTAKNKDKDK